MGKLMAALVSALTVGSSVALAQDAWVEGEVQEIDMAANEITLTHGAIANLGMNAMTMVLRVGNPVMLKNLKEGDKVRFEAQRAPEGVTITKMQKSN